MTTTPTKHVKTWTMLMSRSKLRSKRGKGRKERMKIKLEKMAIENEQHQLETKKLIRKNLELKK